MNYTLYIIRTMFFKIINANGQLEVNNAGNNSKLAGII